MSRIVFFDLDRTLLSGDSEVALVRRLAARGAVPARTMAAILLGYFRYRVGQSHELSALKQAILARLLASFSVKELETVAASVADELLGRLAPDGVLALAAHRAAGDRVVLLSAAVDVIVEPIAKALGVDVVACTRLGREGDRFTGHVIGVMPLGPGKAEVLRQICERHGADPRRTIAYADHFSDRHLLEQVGTAVVINPSRRLAALARDKGWRIERWREAVEAAPHAARA